jgi:F-type H+-transporting ATPase subunit gamma
MATLKDIQIRITSIQNTQQITRAMKLVSASKMKRAEDRIVQARPYSDKLRGTVSNLSQGIDPSTHPLLEQREGGKAIAILVTSDRGLCGGLNSNLCKALDQYLQENSSKYDSVELAAFGKKGAEFFQKTDFNVTTIYRNLREDEMLSAATEKTKELIQQYSKGEFNHILLAFNHFRNVISQVPTVRNILPIEASAEENESSEDQAEFIFEPSPEEILNILLPQYVENQVYTAMLDGFASEHAARMTAMDAATENAAEMIESLQLQYNRARQSAITSELIEIISGAEAAV